MEKHTLEHNIFLNKILASYTQALKRKIALSNDFSQIALSNHFGVVYSSAVKLNPAEDPNHAWEYEANKPQTLTNIKMSVTL